MQPFPPLSSARAWLRHHAATRYAVPRGAGCTCVVCGPSPYDAAGPASLVLRDSFSDADWLECPRAPEVCAGCLRLLSGRPGDEPRPFRMDHALVTKDEVHILPVASDVARLLLDPPEVPFGLVWSTSRKRHAWLRSERCTTARVVVGTDAGPVVFRPADRPLWQAVHALLGAFGRGVVASGRYSPPGVSRVGVAWWRPLEAVVAPYRPSGLLDLLCATVPRPEAAPVPLPSSEEPMLTPADRDAVALLADLAAASPLRRADGLHFWSSVYPHRVRRFARLPLGGMIGRLMRECCVPGTAPLETVREAATWPLPRQEACSRALQARGDLLVVFALDEVKRRRDAP